jgi:uncharacterized protein YjiS (DUF1127 family)
LLLAISHAAIAMLQCSYVFCNAQRRSYIQFVPGEEIQVNPKGTRTMFDNLRKSIAKRARYQRMVNEIQGLTDRDLADFNGNRDEMLRSAYEAVYGR